MNKFIGFVVLVFISISGQSQYRTQAQQLVLSSEDSLQAGINNNKTVISGYGSALYQRNYNMKESVINLERAVLFIGHQFNDKIAIFSEMEIEDAKVEGGSNGGEISMEQAYLKFNLNPTQYIVAGLFVPRIGLLNENHLPVNFNGVERPMVEQMVIPATWRELGIGFYGSMNRAPVNYSLAIVNGLNSAGFEHGTGIRGGRSEGRNASANNLAVTASLQYSWKDFKCQVAGYMGGTVGLNKKSADSLGLNSGAFGTPVYLGEADVQYNRNAICIKALGTFINYPEAGKVNAAYAKNIASALYGGYVEFGYNWLYQSKTNAQFISFARAEVIDMNAKIPTAPKGIEDGTLKQSRLLLGISYLPIPNVVIKADVNMLSTGEQNPALVINPAPNAIPYKQNNTFLNIGFGYSF